MKTNVYHITYSPKFETACLYFEGCNFRCLGCIRRKCNFDIHLPSDIQSQIQTEKKLTFLSIDEILNILNKLTVKKIIFMGGEPTVDSKLAHLAKEIKRNSRTHNILLTNGYILPDITSIDEICIGIKARTSRLHREYTGKDSKPVFRSLKALSEMDISLRTESIFIPGYIDIEETECIARAISEINPDIPHRIDAYIPVPGINWRRPSSPEMEKAVNVARRYLKEVTYIQVNKRKRTFVKILS